MKQLIKAVLGPNAVAWLRRKRHELRQARVRRLPPLNEEAFREILLGKLGLKDTDVVFVHSAVDSLHLDFSFFRILPLLRECVGEGGTLLFPTYPELPSYEFLRGGHIFDVRRSPSFTGILTEVARRQKGAVRSLHPTKSVSALGPLARELTDGHHLSPFPYDRTSPYHRMADVGGKIIGIGVTTRKLSFVHCADDILKDDFPVAPYHAEIFSAKCIDYAGNTVIVQTLAHDRAKMKHNIPRFVKRYCPRTMCEDLVVGGMPFYRADARPLLDRMVDLARKGTTIYARRVYK